MNSRPEAISLSRCDGCGLAYLPSPDPCPRCGARTAHPIEVPPQGTTLAATALTSPATGWSAPHRLALVEVQEAVRLLAIVDGEIPAVGETVALRLDGAVYRARRRSEGAERGEGESPKAGVTRPPFEPPR